MVWFGGCDLKLEWFGVFGGVVWGRVGGGLLIKGKILESKKLGFS